MVFRPTSTVDAVNFTAFALVFLTTGVRLAARRSRMSKLSLDDYLVSFAVVSFKIPISCFGIPRMLTCCARPLGLPMFLSSISNTF